jgi:adenylate cyclase class 2
VAIETEKKFRLEPKQYKKIAGRLKKIGAVFAEETFEENYLHRGGVLDGRGAVLRLRKTAEKTILTYKESIGNDEDVKHKMEFETEVADVDAMEEIIRKLGYRLSVVYEKRRRTWHMDSVEVVLDELPFGLYMEIEGTAKNISKAEKSLGIKNLTAEMRGYPRLTVKYGRMRKGVMEARFGNGSRKEK